MEKETQAAIDKLESNLDTLADSDATELEKGVALEQAYHNAKVAYSLFEESH